MLAYSDSVYYYGQYTEAGSGSFLGATLVLVLGQLVLVLVLVLVLAWLVGLLDTRLLLCG